MRSPRRTPCRTYIRAQAGDRLYFQAASFLSAARSLFWRRNHCRKSLDLRKHPFGGGVMQHVADAGEHHKLRARHGSSKGQSMERRCDDEVRSPAHDKGRHGKAWITRGLRLEVTLEIGHVAGIGEKGRRPQQKERG